ncbi:hypothetical protein FPZ43_12120 [Mucilaginibacter pallidiroseus]|uniref:Pentapeptide MXKDX repeat protein n=1 Tax=Mucilaginibacter pallidiroseus TaxID=2599295 RepID=A0A563UC93_9SPHI|nr:hypothetical protein [Mucilaginibacter pallidiroseus]TWR29001.1 hypothetical protein FPZ43_12120 [Mucilaginibacter pallidiroseus]
MKKSIIAFALILTTGVLSATTHAPIKRDSSTTKKDLGTADTKKDLGTADTKKDLGTADYKLTKKDLGTAD